MKNKELRRRIEEMKKDLGLKNKKITTLENKKKNLQAEILSAKKEILELRTNETQLTTHVRDLKRWGLEIW